MKIHTIAILIVTTVATALAQGRATSFEVVSVKENTSGSAVSSISGPRPGRFTIVNMPLRFIVLEAFGLLDHQLNGGPGWISTTSFDISATFPPGSVPERDWRLMLQAALIDRFGLMVHREMREVPTYDLVLARRDKSPGPKLVPTTGRCEKPEACTLVVSRRSLTARRQALATITPALQSLTGRPVVDRTGLTGTFDIDLTWSATGDDGASIFTALQEQLGLKLEPSKGQADVVVIDTVRPPTPD